MQAHPIPGDRQQGGAAVRLPKTRRIPWNGKKMPDHIRSGISVQMKLQSLFFTGHFVNFIQNFLAIPPFHFLVHLGEGLLPLSNFLRIWRIDLGLSGLFDSLHGHPVLFLRLIVVVSQSWSRLFGQNFR